ncbi:hypothetical protein JW710_04385 [Candidatus Dojkabacteria bacterium]|nr:hypothetical protein [Candidatus Dojkabacteria bacterium]
MKIQRIVTVILVILMVFKVPFPVIRQTIPAPGSFQWLEPLFGLFRDTEAEAQVPIPQIPTPGSGPWLRAILEMLGNLVSGIHINQKGDWCKIVIVTEVTDTSSNPEKFSEATLSLTKYHEAWGYSGYLPGGLGLTYWLFGANDLVKKEVEINIPCPTKLLVLSLAFEFGIVDLTLDYKDPTLLPTIATAATCVVAIVVLSSGINSLRKRRFA